MDTPAHSWIETLHTPPVYERHGGRSVVVAHGYTRRKCSSCAMEWVTLGMSTRVMLADGTFVGGLWALPYACEGGK